MTYPNWGWLSMEAKAQYCGTSFCVGDTMLKPGDELTIKVDITENGWLVSTDGKELGLYTEASFDYNWSVITYALLG